MKHMVTKNLSVKVDPSLFKLLVEYVFRRTFCDARMHNVDSRVKFRINGVDFQCNVFSFQDVGRRVGEIRAF